MNYKKAVLHISEQTNLPENQSWWLLESITQKSRAALIATDYELLELEEKQLDEAIHEIAVKSKPLAYILGWVPFLDLEILVKTPILIPRPETEEWVHQVITMMNKQAEKEQDQFTILDIGSGSGCIALSLAQAFPLAQIYGVDINPQALELARTNAIKNDIKNVTFIESDLFTKIPLNLKFDLIVSNPPYIDPAVKLDASVTSWEDHGALFANNAGLSIIEQIITQAPNHLKKNNELEYQLVIEIDSTQGQIVEELYSSSKFKTIKIRKDQFDRDRTVWANSK
ncbi:peptide chain release factor N(5)-glutamine methyltransferase [Candidatus Babeliales bacterium]|nr:peptide chain release factor N(5)-glutamine methyltransferase [Candidatus Babeliales bacterium]MBP9844089.1 peptide chain release factor N(5)-glutamine methyltransferase [Candidatus Babeliales bacterium]